MRDLELHEPPSDWSDFKTVLFIGDLGQLKALADSPALAPAADALMPALDLLETKARRSDRLTLPLPEGRLEIVALATERGRMSCPARSDLFHKLAAPALQRDGAVLALVALEETSHAAAVASAIARTLPLYHGGSKKKLLSPPVSLALLGPEGPLSGAALDALTPRLQGIRQAARWVDMPPNEFNVSQFVDAAREVAARWGQAEGVEIDVITGADVALTGLGGLAAVGQAALEPPALVVLQGPRSAPDAPQTVWVGKGICYDTGGLSLKGKTAMPGMKSDMAGAAAVLAAFDAACARGAHRDLAAVLCLAENAIGPAAVRPDDIITLYSGKRVEVNNTDAEGRLVLGDGVAWAVQHLQPHTIIDLATLTGAQLVATGRRHAAIVCNDEALEACAVRCGRESGELVHPLPYAPEFFLSEFKSKVADLRNSVADRMNGQSSCAAHFVEAHLGEYQGRWLHIDLAGPAVASGRGTGFGVGLLSTLLTEG